MHLPFGLLDGSVVSISGHTSRGWLSWRGWASRASSYKLQVAARWTVEKQQQSSRGLHLLLNGSTPALLLSLLANYVLRTHAGRRHMRTLVIVIRNPSAVLELKDATEEDLRRTRDGSMHLTFTEPH